MFSTLPAISRDAQNVRREMSLIGHNRLLGSSRAVFYQLCGLGALYELTVTRNCLVCLYSDILHYQTVCKVSSAVVHV